MPALTVTLYLIALKDMGWLGLALSAMVVSELLLEVWLSCRICVEPDALLLRWMFHQSKLEYSEITLRRQEGGLAIIADNGLIFSIRPQWWRRRKKEVIKELEAALGTYVTSGQQSRAGGKLP